MAVVRRGQRIWQIVSLRCDRVEEQFGMLQPQKRASKSCCNLRGADVGVGYGMKINIGGVVELRRACLSIHCNEL
jgi:hypothetical protein